MSSSDLEIRSSLIPGAGSALFTKTDIADGEEVFQSQPLLLTNNICVREPGQSKVLGTALDIVMSLMNHSCDPNVVTVFEGNRLCVRSLRQIEAGEELVQCYTDETCDVLLRRKKLLEQYHFVCQSHEEEHASDRALIKNVLQTQEEVTDLINRTLVDFTASPSLQAIHELEAKALALTATAFPRSYWPQRLDPLPTLYKRLGNMSSMLGQPLPALRYSVKGCAYTQLRNGPDWTSDLLDLVKLLVPVASNVRTFGDDMPMKAAELWIVFMGYLHMLVGLASKLYGKHALYTKAVERWFGDLLEGVNPALLATAGFKRKLKVAHSRLLEWAGVEDHMLAWVL
ncbi:hypothetical protein N0V93_009790 [Gnomoniopsis smithogilvyi]|uniref:SET domain-containing protein n=1 Tax=Gnomoniopsis smithogilvyi TaxID=1191159 RepID=A0A9W9CT55_9PEZI|nr:hypothetical protein N0V93_009790 [Gnomoniopsis smithogilvyi]